MERRMHWYMSISLTPPPKLNLSFSPRTQGNHWLLREQLVKDKPYSWHVGIDETQVKDIEYLPGKTFELIDRALNDLSEKISYYSDVNKIIVHLTKAKFTQTQFFKLAEIIEEQGLQDLIVPRVKI